MLNRLILVLVLALSFPNLSFAELEVTAVMGQEIDAEKFAKNVSFYWKKISPTKERDATLKKFLEFKFLSPKFFIDVLSSPAMSRTDKLPVLIRLELDLHANPLLFSSKAEVLMSVVMNAFQSTESNEELLKQRALRVASKLFELSQTNPVPPPALPAQRTNGTVMPFFFAPNTSMQEKLHALNRFGVRLSQNPEEFEGREDSLIEGITKAFLSDEENLVPFSGVFEAEVLYREHAQQIIDKLQRMKEKGRYQRLELQPDHLQITQEELDRIKTEATYFVEFDGHTYTYIPGRIRLKKGRVPVRDGDKNKTIEVLVVRQTRSGGLVAVIEKRTVKVVEHINFSYEAAMNDIEFVIKKALEGAEFAEQNIRDLYVQLLEAGRPNTRIEQKLVEAVFNGKMGPQFARRLSEKQSCEADVRNAPKKIPYKEMLLQEAFAPKIGQ